MSEVVAYAKSMALTRFREAGPRCGQSQLARFPSFNR